MNIIISQKILKKLIEKHSVTRNEVEEAIANIEGKLLKDSRDKHITNPPTHWFIAETNKCRKLKVCLVIDGGKLYIKTAYDPNQSEIEIYEENAL